MRRKLYLITLISCLLAWHSNSQGLLLSYNTKDTLTICGTQRLDLLLENTGMAVINDIEITMQCPSGIRYQPGSVINAEEISVNPPDRPVFRVVSVAPGSKYVFSITLECGCEAFEKANMAQRFENMFWIAYNNRIDSLRSSPPYPVYTPFVILADVPDVTVPVIMAFIMPTICGSMTPWLWPWPPGCGCSWPCAVPWSWPCAWSCPAPP